VEFFGYHHPMVLRTVITLLITLQSICCCGCLALNETDETETFGVNFTPPKGQKIDDVRGAIVFVVDGLNAEIFQQMLDAGELPAIKRYFVDRGLYAPRAVGNIPSITFANLTSLVTGQFPGHNNIPSITWFDRDTFVWRNYNTIAQKNKLDDDYTVPNIYELLGKDAVTVSIFFQPHRGTTKFFENAISAAPVYAFGWYYYLDRLTLYRFGEMMDLARSKWKKFPTLTYAYLLAPDFMGYTHGVDSPQYRRAIRHTDQQIGRILGDLKTAGLLNKIIIALVSDHSLGNVKKHFDFEKYLRDELLLNVSHDHLWEDTPEQRRQNYYNRFSAVVYGNGDRFRAISLRVPVSKNAIPAGFASWDIRPAPRHLRSYPNTTGKTIDLLSVLIKKPAVDAIAWAMGKNKCCVRTKRGVAEFSQPDGRDGKISCKIVTGDPFGWAGKVSEKLLGGQPASSRQWLKATCDTSYPDLPAQILSYFRGSRAGDIAVFATSGWDFGSTNSAGHGGLDSYEDLCVPLLLAGPGVPHKRASAVRTVDLVPTILKLLDKTPPKNMDGISLIPIR
jgi:predicted AlkP superfamily phosphohydrolase/phosphomutase